MRIVGLNHFNIVCADLEKSAQFYEAFGLKRGVRPDFGNHGIWLYHGIDPVLHLNDAWELGHDTRAKPSGVFHHVGLSVSGQVHEVCAKLTSLGIDHRIWEPAVPGWYRALYFFGPDGEEIELVLTDCYVPVMEYKLLVTDEDLISA